MVTHVFDNSNISQEIFAIDSWRAVICSLGHDRKAHAYDPSDYMETSLQLNRPLRNTRITFTLCFGYFSIDVEELSS